MEFSEGVLQVADGNLQVSGRCLPAQAASSGRSVPELVGVHELVVISAHSSAVNSHVDPLVLGPSSLHKGPSVHLRPVARQRHVAAPSGDDLQLADVSAHGASLEVNFVDECVRARSISAPANANPVNANH